MKKITFLSKMSLYLHAHEASSASHPNPCLGAAPLDLKSQHTCYAWGSLPHPGPPPALTFLSNPDSCHDHRLLSPGATPELVQEQDVPPPPAHAATTVGISWLLFPIVLPALALTLKGCTLIPTSSFLPDGASLLLAWEQQTHPGRSQFSAQQDTGLASIRFGALLCVKLLPDLKTPSFLLPSCGTHPRYLPLSTSRPQGLHTGFLGDSS